MKGNRSLMSFLRGINLQRTNGIRIGLIALVCSFGRIGYGQQDPQFTQYMFNNQYFNPAYAGSADYITGMLFHRAQWVNFEGAPVTQNLTGIVPFQRNHFALGFNLVNDNIGQVKTGSLNINFSFAYYVNLKNGRLSFGVGAGIQQFRFDPSNLRLKDNTDESFLNVNISKISPDFNFGVFYKTNRYYVGISSTHLNNPGRTISDLKAVNPATTARHYYLSGGYSFEVDEKFKVTPSTVFKYSESKLLPNNIAIDFSIKTEYLEMVWLGTGYRTSFKNANALSFFTGINIGKINADIFKENIKIGYAYDIPIGALPAYSDGSHEIFISYEYAPKVKRMMPKFK